MNSNEVVVMRMKEKMKQIGSFVIAVAVLMSLSSCLQALNRSSAGDIEKLLQEKYGTEFQVISIGNRLASSGMDTVTAYCRPVDDTRVVFEAKMNTHHQLVSDSFVERVVEVQAEKALEESFSNEGIQASVYAHIFPVPEDTDYRNADYLEIIKSTPDSSFTFKTVVSERTKDDKVYNAITSVLMSHYQLNDSLKCGTSAYNIIADQYNDCVKKMRTGGYPSKTFFEGYMSLGSATVSVVDGKVNVELDEFQENFYH